MLLSPRLVLTFLPSCALFLSTASSEAADPRRPATDELPIVPASTTQEEQRVSPSVIAVAAGAGTSFVSLLAGTLIIARSEERDVRNAALLGAQTGLCLSPLIAHAVVGETKRGLAFATIPLFALALNATLMSFYPNFINKAPAGVQWATFTAMTISIFGSTLGVLDASNAPERAAKRIGIQGLSFSAMVDRNTTFAAIGGSL